MFSQLSKNLEINLKEKIQFLVLKVNRKQNKTQKIKLMNNNFCKVNRLYKLNPIVLICLKKLNLLKQTKYSKININCLKFQTDKKIGMINPTNLTHISGLKQIRLQIKTNLMTTLNNHSKTLNKQKLKQKIL